ncbi:MAG: LpqB family beta-propeller domain-containing protein, partial [Umezawaea sp.]
PVHAADQAPFGPSTAMRLSRDGTRVACVIDGTLIVASVVRGEDSSVALRIPQKLQSGLLGNNVLSVDWLAQDVLVASTSLSSNPVVRVNLDGLKVERYNTSNLTAPVTSVAAAPGRPVMAVDHTGLWSATEVGDVWRGSQVKPDPGAFVFYPG